MSFDEAATVSAALLTAAVRFYTPSSGEAPGGLGLVAPWNGGRGKYAHEPILILGGSSSVGQAGECIGHCGI